MKIIKAKLTSRKRILKPYLLLVKVNAIHKIHVTNGLIKK